MTEDNFEKFLKKTAQSYNAPPVRVPREEMWAAIQAKRAAGPRVVYGGGSATPAHGRHFGTKVWLGAAAAAMLLVATGVGIGRWTASPAPTVASKPGSSPVPVGTVAGEQANAPTATTPTEVASGSSQASGESVTAVSAGPRSSTGARSSAGLTRRPVSVENVASGKVGRTNPGPRLAGPSSAYQLTTLQNLSDAEALLTSFRNRSSADQQMDAQLGTWARQLLSNTRLLLDSPVGDDPQRRPLLQDLELVLVQIVQQLSPGSTPQDRELIEKTLQQNHVMTRLRTAIPAGAQHGG